MDITLLEEVKNYAQVQYDNCPNKTKETRARKGAYADVLHVIQNIMDREAQNKLDPGNIIYK